MWVLLALSADAALPLEAMESKASLREAGDGPDRRAFDPGPPAKDPKEEMEPDPSWSWKPGRTGQAAAETKVPALSLGVRSFQARASLIEASLEQGSLAPFFQVAKDERVGDVKFFFPGTFFRSDDAQLRHLTWTRHGFLFWHYGCSRAIVLLTPTGMHTALEIQEGNRGLQYLGGNSKGELLYFGETEYGSIENEFAAPGAKRTGGHFSFWRRKSPGPLRRVFPGGDDDFWLQGRNSLHHVGSHGHLGETLTRGQDAPWTSVSGLVSSGALLVGTRPELDEVLLLTDRKHLITRKIPGGRPHAVAKGPGGQIWVTLEGLDQFLVVDSRTCATSRIALPPSTGARGLGALALGPDGNMWVAMAGLGAIGRVTPEGKLSRFRLLPGDVPLELVPTPEGLLFTLERSDRIGFIRAVPVAQATPGAAASAVPGGDDWAGPAHVPRPMREKALSRAERWALQDARQLRAEQRERDRNKAAAPPPAQAGKAEQPRQGDPVAAVPEPPTGPLATLAALGVQLTAGDVRHILKQHACGSNRPGKGQFAEQHSTREGLEKLLARCLEDCGAIGRITEASGVCYTKCAAPKVGWYCAYNGALVPADHFVVVTARSWNEVLRDHDHGVITAYPVHPNW